MRLEKKVPTRYSHSSEKVPRNSKEFENLRFEIIQSPAAYNFEIIMQMLGVHILKLKGGLNYSKPTPRD